MINRQYSAVVFDLGQVIVPFDYKYFVEKVNRHKSGIGEQFLNLYKKNYYIHRDFEKGLIPEKQFINTMLGFLDNVIDGEAFCNYWSDIFTPDDKVISLLSILKQKYKLYLISNTNSIHKKYGFGHYEFLNLFDHLFLSHEVGFIKPEKEIYNAVEKISEFPPEEHIFIDDILEYVNAAKVLGWDGIQFLGYDDLVKNLKMRDIL